MNQTQARYRDEEKTLQSGRSVDLGSFVQVLRDFLQAGQVDDGVSADLPPHGSNRNSDQCHMRACQP